MRNDFHLAETPTACNYDGAGYAYDGAGCPLPAIMHRYDLLGLLDKKVFPQSKFTSKERDAETGLDYFGARYFSSAQGRFTSPDPTFLNIRKVFNPQRWNLYVYGVNNPLKFVDPDGNEAVAVDYPATLEMRKPVSITPRLVIISLGWADS